MVDMKRDQQDQDRNRQQGSGGQQQQSSQGQSKWKVKRAGTFSGGHYQVGQEVSISDEDAERANREAQSNTSAAQFEQAG